MELSDAEAQRDSWELERMSAAAAMRPKITRLTQAQLVEAEGCHELLKGSGFSLSDAVRHLLRKPPVATCELTFAEAYRQFLDARKPFVSEVQLSNYLSPCRRLSAYLGEGTKLVTVESGKVHAWLASLGVSSKSWNNYRGDLTVVFNWFTAAPRRWLSENPLAEVPRYRKRDTLPERIEVLSWSVVRDLMHWLEREKPHWVMTFALAVFVGIRPDRDDGEMSKLADAVIRATKVLRSECVEMRSAGSPQAMAAPWSRRNAWERSMAFPVPLRVAKMGWSGSTLPLAVRCS